MYLNLLEIIISHLEVTFAWLRTMNLEYPVHNFTDISKTAVNLLKTKTSLEQKMTECTFKLNKRKNTEPNSPARDLNAPLVDS